MADRKDMYQPAPAGKPGSGTSELPNQQSVELLIALLQDYQRRATQNTLPAEVERDIKIVNTVLESINTALALGLNKTTINPLNPATGSTAGGTSVIITGTQFLPGAKVRFGEKFASSANVVSETEIRAITPAGTGIVDVSVSTFAGSARRVGGFTYQTP
jgi:IPT/TIG domain